MSRRQREWAVFLFVTGSLVGATWLNPYALLYAVLLGGVAALLLLGVVICRGKLRGSP